MEALSSIIDPVDDFVHCIKARVGLLIVHLNLEALALFHNRLDIALSVNSDVATGYKSLKPAHCVVSQLVLLLKLLDCMFHFCKFGHLFLDLLLLQLLKPSLLFYFELSTATLGPDLKKTDVKECIYYRTSRKSPLE